jgi:hypothetical protein
VRVAKKSRPGPRRTTPATAFAAKAKRLLATLPRSA